MTSKCVENKIEKDEVDKCNSYIFQETALHLAVQSGHASVVEFLMSNKDQDCTENTLNKNILDMAIEHNQKAVAMVLASHRR